MLWYKVGLVLFMLLLNVVDYHTTYVLIDRAGDVEIETNPLLLWLMQVTGSVYSILAYKMVSLTVIFSLVHHIKIGWLILIDVLYLAVCVRSLLMVYGGM